MNFAVDEYLIAMNPRFAVVAIVKLLFNILCSSFLFSLLMIDLHLLCFMFDIGLVAEYFLDFEFYIRCNYCSVSLIS